MSADLTFVDSSGNLVQTENHLNMANSNTSAFLGALGLDTRFWEAAPMTVEEFSEALDRFVKSDIGDYVDGGTETVELGNIVCCGRAPGYMAARGQLAAAILAEAMANGATQVYFA